METGHVYSRADRCEKCAMRALLVEATAHALVRESFGALAMYRCPQHEAWHVWNPRAEHDSVHRPRFD